MYILSIVLLGKYIIKHYFYCFKRIHLHVRQSGELVFVDASGGFDADGYRVFLFMTHSACGGMNLKSVYDYLKVMDDDLNTNNNIYSIINDYVITDNIPVKTTKN